MTYNIDGLKYFIYNTTINNKNYLEIPKDIRILIWKYAHNYSYIQCYICDKILINLEINTFNNIQTENFSIINGISRCSTC
jgi:hypothetical protein